MDEKFGCATCSKESYDIVPIARVLEKIDALFQKNDLDGVGRILDYWESEARKLNDKRGLLEILNEKIGYYRRTNNKRLGLFAVEEAFSLIERLGLTNLESSGTVYLNGATTLKAFGEAAEAMKYYGMAKDIYLRVLPCDDFKLAAFYNNISSAYKELGDTHKCEEACLKAISILEKNIGYSGEMAISHINLAHLYYDMGSMDERIYERMERAWELLMSNDNVYDGNFAFICSKCHPSFAFFGYFEYERILKEIVRKIYEGN